MPERLAADAQKLLLQICQRAFGAGAAVRQGYVFRLQTEAGGRRATLTQPHVSPGDQWAMPTTRDLLSQLEAAGYFERAPQGVLVDGLQVQRAGLTALARDWYVSQD